MPATSREADSSGEGNPGSSSTTASLSLDSDHHLHSINHSRSTLTSAIMANSSIINQLSYRLPKEIKPLYYNLRIHPNLYEKTFQGFINIGLKILKPISFIPVHSNSLNVSTEKVLQVNETTGSAIRELTPKLTFSHPDFEYWVTEFSEPLEAGNYTISYNFNGSLANSIVGLYQSSYWDKQRQLKR